MQLRQGQQPMLTVYARRKGGAAPNWDRSRKWLTLRNVPRRTETEGLGDKILRGSDPVFGPQTDFGHAVRRALIRRCGPTRTETEGRSRKDSARSGAGQQRSVGTLFRSARKAG